MIPVQSRGAWVQLGGTIAKDKARLDSVSLGPKTALANDIAAGTKGTFIRVLPPTGL